MMRALIATLLLPTSLQVSADVDRSPQSLVGGWPIPADSVLASETVTLWFRNYQDSSIHPALSYTLAPNGKVTIEHGRDRTTCCFGGIDHHFTDSTRTAQLAPGEAQTIRRMLARLRPENLSKDIPFSLPLGCSWIHDGGAWGGAGFDRGKLGGAFVFQPGCTGPGADEAKQLMRQVIAQLPAVEGAAGFVK